MLQKPVETPNDFIVVKCLICTHDTVWPRWLCWWCDGYEMAFGPYFVLRRNDNEVRPGSYLGRF